MIYKKLILLLFLCILSINAHATIMVFSPHPDDDILTSSGIIKHANYTGNTVITVYMTNGDFGGIDIGYLRQGEAVDAQEQFLDSIEDNLIFLGYPDGYLQEIYNNYPSITDVYVSPNNQSTTYGNRGLGRTDYHSYQFGSPANYNLENLVTDVESIIATYLPDQIITTDKSDAHTDHSTTYLIVRAAVSRVMQNNTNYNPVINKTIVWAPNPDFPSPIDPTIYHSIPPTLPPEQLPWNLRESIDVPLPMQDPDLSVNPKYQALSVHVDPTQELGDFIHKDELFWPESFDQANQPPTVEAGTGLTVDEGNLVQLDGTASTDPEGNTLSYTWTQVNGPAVLLYNDTTSTPSFYAPSGLLSDTSLTFQLIVNDGTYSSLPDLVTVTVRSANTVHAPFANAGTDQTVNENNTVQLDGSASADPDGDPLTYQWTQIGGPAVTLADPTAAITTFVAPAGLTQNTDLTFELVVNDGTFSSTPDSVVVTVIAANPSPNIASQATVSASSEDTSTSQFAANVIDGIIDGYPGDYTREWATLGETAGAWIELQWTTPVVVDRVVLYDRPNVADHVTGGTLVFSDGTTVPVPSLNNDGSATEVTFPSRVITSLRFNIDSTGPDTVNIGLAEWEVY